MAATFPPVLGRKEIVQSHSVFGRCVLSLLALRVSFFPLLVLVLLYLSALLGSGRMQAAALSVCRSIFGAVKRSCLARGIGSLRLCFSTATAAAAATATAATAAAAVVVVVCKVWEGILGSTEAKCLEFVLAQACSS